MLTKPARKERPPQWPSTPASLARVETTLETVEVAMRSWPSASARPRLPARVKTQPSGSTSPNWASTRAFQSRRAVTGQVDEERP